MLNDDSCEGSGSECLEDLMAAIIAMAQLDFSKPPPIRGSGVLGAMAMGLSALGEELQASAATRKEAEQANEAKNRFLANMSHELRTPLTSLLGCLELLEGKELTPSQRQLVNLANRSGSTLLRLVGDILDIAESEAGVLTLKEERFQLPGLLDALMGRFRCLADAKGMPLIDERSEMPTVALLGDEERLLQCLSNLVHNAIKFSDVGEVRLRSHAELEGGRWRLTFEVRDNGPGIHEDCLETIFDRFTLGDSSLRRRWGGSGLGLSISQSLAEMMGGAVTVQSQLGQGSCFTLTVSLVSELAVESVPTGDCPPVEIRSLRVLVVDDMELVRTVTANMLEVLGCVATLAVSGAEALELVAAQDFDLVLMDCQMPHMDGYEAVRRLLARFPRYTSKVVAFTAHTSDRDRALSLEAGMVEHLSKPFTVDGLRQILVRYAAGPSAQR